MHLAGLHRLHRVPGPFAVGATPPTAASDATVGAAPHTAASDATTAVAPNGVQVIL